MSRSSWIQLLLFLHILGAIAAIGPTLTYGIWIPRAEKQSREIRAFAVRGTTWVDDHLATPAFMMQAVTGGFLVWLGRFSFLHTAWLLMGVGLYVVVTVFALTVFAPVVRRRNEAAERTVSDPSDPDAEGEYQALGRRVRIMAAVPVVITLGILYVMIVKPPLWSAG